MSDGLAIYLTQGIITYGLYLMLGLYLMHRRRPFAAEPPRYKSLNPLMAVATIAAWPLFLSLLMGMTVAVIFGWADLDDLD